MYSAAKYPEYATERIRLTRLLESKKDRLFGTRPRWNEERSDRYLREKPPTMRQLNWAVYEADEGDLLDALREDPETFRWVGYH